MCIDERLIRWVDLLILSNGLIREISMYLDRRNLFIFALTKMDLRIWWRFREHFLLQAARFSGVVETHSADILPGRTSENQIIGDPGAHWSGELCLELVNVSITHSWFAPVLGAQRHSPVSHFPAARRDPSEELFWWFIGAAVVQHLHSYFFKSSLCRTNVETSIVYGISLLELLPL